MVVSKIVIPLIYEYKSLIQAIIYQKKTDGIRKGNWQKTELSKVLQERTEKNINGYTVCSVSVSQGIINQIEYLGRSFAAKETSHYNVVKYGDIVYTKSPTGDFPYGIVKRSYIKNAVAVSPLYGVYKPIDDNIGVILHFYFMQPNNAFNYLHPLIQKGAKNTINITNTRFLGNSIPLPKTEDEAVLRIDPKQLDTLLHPQFDPEALKAAVPLGSGLAASPGSASGRIVFSAEEAAEKVKDKDWKKGKAPFIRQFENYIGILMGYEPEACEQRGRCSLQCVAEADGSAYPCDFYVLDKYRLGNYNTDTIEEMTSSRNGREFVRESYRTDPECEACRWYSLCRGGCRRHRIRDDGSEIYRNYFCEGYRMFFERCYKRMSEIAQYARIIKM